METSLPELFKEKLNLKYQEHGYIGNVYVFILSKKEDFISFSDNDVTIEIRKKKNCYKVYRIDKDTPYVIIGCIEFKNGEYIFTPNRDKMKLIPKSILEIMKKVIKIENSNESIVQVVNEFKPVKKVRSTVVVGYL